MLDRFPIFYYFNAEIISKSIGQEAMFKREINDQSILSRVLFLTMNGCFPEIQKKKTILSKSMDN